VQTLLERLHTWMDSKPYGERLMLIRYRMHGEQIANIAQTMRELYHVRRDYSSTNSSPRTDNSTVSRDIHDEMGGANPRFSVRNTAKNVKPLKSRKRKGSGTDPAPAQQSLLAIKCSRCGDTFPVTDFQYTKESGLCIPCWELKIKVMKCR
jgi:formylmethanofuran dehydrogenase subunit E